METSGKRGRGESREACLCGEVMSNDDDELLRELVRDLRDCKARADSAGLLDLMVKLRAIARRHLPPKSVLRLGFDSEDLAQEGIAHLIANIERFRGSTLKEFFAFVTAVISQQAARQARWQGVRKGEIGSSEDAADHASDSRTASANVVGREDVQRLMELVDKLDEPYRSTLLMMMRGRTNAEIAAALDIREDLVRKRLSRALQTLRGQYG